MRAISERVFWEKYKPLPDPRGNGHTWEFRDTVAFPLERLWSLIEGETNHRNLYAVPGYHIVNVLGYCVTEEPWTDGGRDARFFSA